ncbi:hypothetical protein CLOSTHATH_05676 [Hungatella hathewayi DSM 13479]|uniref:Uncharacterized protein n=1 Tax=Hungatella hathewayi DSM 13479 TaxID=566550 RepID=D3APX2_9FIRM|nr:hypothetical protein CLOSTHATH_05676 [Hungatella hathewayi DSM 13479]
MISVFYKGRRAPVTDGETIGNRSPAIFLIINCQNFVRYIEKRENFMYAK